MASDTRSVVSAIWVLVKAKRQRPSITFCEWMSGVIALSTHHVKTVESVMRKAT
jgi:hypothetical protein